MSAVHFAVPVLIAGVAATLAGVAWLSRAGAGSDYLLAVALPMVLIGVGQGLAFVPMTSAGLGGVSPADAGRRDAFRAWAEARHDEANMTSIDQ